MKTKIEIESLMIEVTRRCNMLCEHCLRGTAQNIDISKEIIDKLLDNISSIGNVTFTGGEITLNLPIIEYFFEELKRRKIGCNSYWMCTNGLINQYELTKILVDHYYDMECPECNGVALSKDEFHDDIALSPIELLNFYDSSKDRRNIKDWLIAEGKAVENGFYAKSPYHKLELDITDYNENNVEISELYVSALGEILVDCDYSYLCQRDVNLGTIDDLEKIINEAIEEKEA